MPEQPSWSKNAYGKGNGVGNSLLPAVLMGLAMVGAVGGVYGGWWLWQNRPDPGREAFEAYAAASTVGAARLEAVEAYYPDEHAAIRTRFMERVNKGATAADAVGKADGEVMAFYQGHAADMAAATPTELGALAVGERELMVHVRSTDLKECVMFAGRSLTASAALKPRTRKLFGDIAHLELKAAIAGQTARRVYPTVGDPDARGMGFHLRQFDAPNGADGRGWKLEGATDADRCQASLALIRGINVLVPEQRAQWMSGLVSKSVDTYRVVAEGTRAYGSYFRWTY